MGMAQIKTADQVKASISAHQAKMSAEKREFRRAQMELEKYQDLRDDVMSLVKNSQMSYEDIHARCGPCPATLENWAQKKVDQPRLGKLRATLLILGFDFGIIPKG